MTNEQAKEYAQKFSAEDAKVVLALVAEAYGPRALKENVTYEQLKQEIGDACFHCANRLTRKGVFPTNEQLAAAMVTYLRPTIEELTEALGEPT